MPTLKELYTAMGILSKCEGVTIDENLKEQVAKLEEDLIRRDILPMLRDKIEPALATVQRELVLVVDYVPGEPLKVSLSRKRNFADVLTDAVEILPDPLVEHKSFGKQKAKKQDIAPKTRLKVTMPDGTIINRPKAKDTLVEVVKLLGPDRVRALGFKWCKIPFISNTRDAKYGKAQEDVGNGWLVLTHSGTKDKKKLLDKIAKALGVKLKVEVIG